MRIEEVRSSGNTVVPSININQDTNWSWHSTISTESGLVAERLRNLGGIPAKLKRFVSSPKHPDQCWGPTSFLFNRYRGFLSKEIQHRITLGNKAYCANQFLCKSRSVSKKSKLKLYCSIIRPTVTYACETWVLKETTKDKLVVFERKVLRKMFGPTKERDGT
jgi:hypothetical protein